MFLYFHRGVFSSIPNFQSLKSLVLINYRRAENSRGSSGLLLGRTENRENHPLAQVFSMFSDQKSFFPHPKCGGPVNRSSVLILHGPPALNHSEELFKVRSLSHGHKFHDFPFCTACVEIIEYQDIIRPDRSSRKIGQQSNSKA